MNPQPIPAGLLAHPLGRYSMMVDLNMNRE
jgi:hypothetical protein